MLTDEELDMMQIIGHVAEVSNRYHELVTCFIYDGDEDKLKEVGK